MMIRILTALSIASLALFAKLPLGGEVVGRNIYGVFTDYKGDPLQIEGRTLIADTISSTSAIEIKGKKKSQDFVVSSMVTGEGIGNIYITKTTLTGSEVTPIDTYSIDLSKANGIYKPTAATRTPWNTILFAQSGTIDSKNDSTFIKSFMPYFKNKENLINSYNYGWSFESVVLDTKGSAKIVNNYALGRVFAEKVAVSSDGKSIYSYDMDSKFLFKFEPKKEKNLLDGTIYVAKQNGTSIQWLELTKSSALRVKLKLRKAPKFSDIFKTSKPSNSKCSKGYSYASSIYGEECLKINKKFKKYVGVFEPIRLASIQGASKISKTQADKIMEGK